MPLKHDPEYQNELQNISSDAYSTTRSILWRDVVLVVAFLSLAIYTIKTLEIGSSTEILLMLGACTISLIAVIHAALGRIHSSLVLLIAATEWVGRKQLGEYEQPE